MTVRCPVCGRFLRSRHRLDTAPKGPGRPSKFSEAAGNELVELIASGLTLGQAATAIGVTPRTVHNWRRRYAELERRLVDATSGRR